MFRFLATVFLSFLFAFQAFAKSSLESDLIGKWKAIGYFYQGTFIQPTEAMLLLTFEFRTDGTNTLFWKMKDSESFCEREGRWLVKDEMLVDEVVSVNEKSGMDCSGDPDMQVGKINISHFWKEGSQIFVEIPLADEYLIYVWDPF